MNSKRSAGIFSAIASMLLAHPVTALEANKSNLWFGGDEGIEVISRTGKNLAYTKGGIAG